jgi:hypothetical protein
MRCWCGDGKGPALTATTTCSVARAPAAPGAHAVNRAWTRTAALPLDVTIRSRTRRATIGIWCCHCKGPALTATSTCCVARAPAAPGAHTVDRAWTRTAALPLHISVRSNACTAAMRCWCGDGKGPALTATTTCSVARAPAAPGAHTVNRAWTRTAALPLNVTIRSRTRRATIGIWCCHCKGPALTATSTCSVARAPAAPGAHAVNRAWTRTAALPLNVTIRSRTRRATIGIWCCHCKGPALTATSTCSVARAPAAPGAHTRHASAAVHCVACLCAHGAVGWPATLPACCGIVEIGCAVAAPTGSTAGSQRQPRALVVGKVGVST